MPAAGIGEDRWCPRIVLEDVKKKHSAWGALYKTPLSDVRNLAKVLDFRFEVMRRLCTETPI